MFAFLIYHLGSDDRTVRLWDLSSDHCIDCKHVLLCHTCADLKFDRNKVLTASFDNTIGLWEWSSGNCLAKFRGHVGAGKNVIFPSMVF